METRKNNFKEVKPKTCLSEKGLWKHMSLNEKKTQKVGGKHIEKYIGVGEVGEGNIKMKRIHIGFECEENFDY
jgi:hypothetical protein